MKAYLLAILIGTAPNQVRFELNHTFDNYEHCMEVGKIFRVQLRDEYGRTERYVVECRKLEKSKSKSA